LYFHENQLDLKSFLKFIIMKKIVAALTLLLAFSISANAQDEKTTQEKKAYAKEKVALTPPEASRKDADAITEFLRLDAKMRENFVGLFRMKHEVMQDPSSTIERKKEMSRIVGLKIEASIDANLLQKLKANTALYQQLTSEDLLEVKKSK
jgi:hypothetical protein